MQYRRRKRAMHHAEAHSGESGPARILSHAEVPQGEPEVAGTQRELESLVEHLRQAGTFAYDTEFIGEETFHPRICLVQVATRERVALVDPFARLDLAPLWHAVCDPAHLVIVHAGAQDVGAARREAGIGGGRVVDTQIACAMVGMPWPASLGSMVEALTGHRLAKGHTFTEWDARPLSPSQRRYAADDVRYLPLAWRLLEDRLRDSGRLGWVEEECADAMQQVNSFDPEGQVRRACKGLSMRPRTMTVLRELVILRHELARQADVPPRALIPDAPLLDLARSKPKQESDLGGIRGLARPTVQRHGARILETIRSASESPIERDSVWTPPEEGAEDRLRIDALWSIVCLRCIAQGIAPGILMSRLELARWYLGRRDGSPPFPGCPWRQSAMGEWIERFVSGGTDFGVRWGPKGPDLGSLGAG